MIFIKDNQSAFQLSNIQSSAIIITSDDMTSYCREEKSSAEMITKSPQKPALISKRTVSLPADLQNTTVKTRNLFWFIPSDQRSQRNHLQYRNDDSDYCKTSPAERYTGNRMIRQLPCGQEFPETASLQSITASTSSLSDSSSEHSEDYYYDHDDCPLLGLEFIESQTEIEIEAENENHHP